MMFLIQKYIPKSQKRIPKSQKIKSIFRLRYVSDEIPVQNLGSVQSILLYRIEAER